MDVKPKENHALADKSSFKHCPPLLVLSSQAITHHSKTVTTSLIVEMILSSLLNLPYGIVLYVLACNRLLTLQHSW